MISTDDHELELSFLAKSVSVLFNSWPSNHTPPQTLHQSSLMEATDVEVSEPQSSGHCSFVSTPDPATSSAPNSSEGKHNGGCRSASTYRRGSQRPSQTLHWKPTAPSASRISRVLSSVGHFILKPSAPAEPRATALRRCESGARSARTPAGC
jgi:hypothetical protein